MKRLQAWRYWPDRALHTRIWALAWPMMLSNITVPLLGLVDTAVIGHLPSPHYLGAVAVGSTIFSVLYWAFGFLRMGTTGMVAQACGRNDGDTNRTLLAQSLLMAALIGCALILLRIPLTGVALELMDPAPDVLAEAREYTAVRVFGCTGDAGQLRPAGLVRRQPEHPRAADFAHQR